jgi:hypothetical protein
VKRAKTGIGAAGLTQGQIVGNDLNNIQPALDLVRYAHGKNYILDKGFGLRKKSG